MRAGSILCFAITALLVSFPAISVGFWLTKYWVEYIPKLYGPNVPVVEIGASAVGTHLAGTAVFVLIGYRKVSFLWVVVWIVTLAMVGATNRGATLAALVPVTFAMIMLGRLRLMLTTLAGGISASSAVLYAAEATFTQYEEAKDSIERPVSAHQIVENAQEYRWAVRAADGGNQAMASRLVGRDYQRYVPWAKLLDRQGIWLESRRCRWIRRTRSSQSSPPTRSPHNAFMTLLARAGVPGVVLWSLVLISWSGMMLRAMLVARARGHKQWAELFLFITCYAMSIIINAAFDVTLEGPMQGIWFWCLFGFGIGSVMVYRAQAADGIAELRSMMAWDSIACRREGR